jgi:hypothetical protein
MRSTSGCILRLRSSLLLLLLAAPAGFAQTAGRDTLYTKGVRIGFDLSRVANYYITEKKVRSFEVSADLRLQNKLLYVAEAGIATIAKEAPAYTFRSNGYYGRLGIERNMLKGGNDILFFGARYGLSAFNFQSDRFVVSEPYWGEEFESSYPKENFLAQWLEGVAGLKGNVFGNFYLGFTARFKLRVALSGNRDVGAITIPGFGDASQRSAFGFNYYVFYQIPLSDKQ